MKKQHILLAAAVTAIRGLNSSAIRIGPKSVDPLTLAAIRSTLSTLPAVFSLKRPQVPWRHTIGYGLVFGGGLWGAANPGTGAGAAGAPIVAAPVIGLYGNRPAESGSAARFPSAGRSR